MMEGILVACDQNQEWLLPWWWDHYSKHNSYPVAFADFGMSETALAWCRERGQTIELPTHDDPLRPLSSENKELWGTLFGEGIWSFREPWIKKPLAFLHTPFPLSCWIDLDCEVRGNLAPLFSLGMETEIAIARDIAEDRSWNLPEETAYNSGVVVFHQNSKIIRHWAEMAANRNHQFLGDQEVLSRVIYLHQPSLVELPQIYNWHKLHGANPEALILHYAASWKLEILETLTKKKSTE